MDKDQTLEAFWNSFDIPAYEEHSVPDRKEFPYITYNANTGVLGNTMTTYCDIWYRTPLWGAAIRKKDEILQRILRNGSLTLPFDGGYIFISDGSPLVQRVEDADDDMVKRFHLNFTAEFLCRY